MAERHERKNSDSSCFLLSVQINDQVFKFWPALNSFVSYVYNTPLKCFLSDFINYGNDL